MAPAFDPYYKWLGIPPAEQPPNHYRLLAINLFESDPDVIEAAADQRMVHLRSLQTGQYSDLSQELLNKISTAKICLLKPDKKSQYDAALRQQLTASGPIAAAIPLAPAALPPSSPRPQRASATSEPPRVEWEPEALSMPNASAGFKPKSRTSAANTKQASLTPWLIGAAGAAVVVVAIVIASNSDSENSGDRSHIPGRVASAEGTSGESPSGKTSKGNPPAKNPVKPSSRDEHSSKSTGSTNNSVTVPPTNNTPNPAPPPVNPPDQKQPDKNPPPEKHPEKPPEKAPPDKTPDKTPEKQPDKTPDKTPPEKSPEKQPEKSPTKKPDKQPSAVKPADDNRLPVPDSVVQQQATAELKDALKIDFTTASTIEARQALAKKLVKLADDTKTNPALRYVMLTEALELAQKVNDPAVAIDALAKLCQLYAVDSWDLRSKTFSHLSRSARTPDAHQLITEKVLPLVDGAIADDRYDTALVLAAAAVSMTSDKTDKLVDPVLRDKAAAARDRCRRLQRDARDAAAAKDKLASDPDDAEANFVVGRFLCLEKDNWSEGLPFLVRGNEDGLKDVASRETVAPTDATAQLSLADAWWDLAEKPTPRTSSVVRPMFARARFWYKRALPGLTGLTLEKAQQRLKEEEIAAQDMANAKGIFLDDLPEQNVSVARGEMGKHGATGFPKDDNIKQIVVHGVEIKHGLMTNPPKKGSAHVSYAIEGKFRTFTGAVAIMDGAGNPASPITFRVLGDGKLLWASLPLKREGDGQEFKIRLPLIHTLQLEVHCPDENAHAWCVWINPTVSK